MAKTLKFGIFDYDGVLVDSFKCLYESYGAICARFGLLLPSLEKLKQLYLEHSKYTDLLTHLGIASEHHKEADEIFTMAMNQREPALFSGIEEVLGNLCECMPLALVSSNHKPVVEPVLKKHRLGKYFRAVITNKTMGNYLEKTPVMNELMLDFHVSGDQTFSVGDRTMDFIHSMEAGIPADNIVMVEYGWGYERKRLEGYNLMTVVREPCDIIGAIREIESRD